MKLKPIDPPREFKFNPNSDIVLKHCLDLELDADEQVTLTTSDGKEFDVVRKAWGYYATSSLNGRLKSFGLRGVLADSRGRRFLLLVEEGKEAEFEAYIEEQGMSLIAWLDGPEIEHVDESVRAGIKPGAIRGK